MNSRPHICNGYRFLPDIISDAIWLFHCFYLSSPEAEDLLTDEASLSMGCRPALLRFNCAKLTIPFETLPIISIFWSRAVNKKMGKWVHEKVNFQRKPFAGDGPFIKPEDEPDPMARPKKI